MAKEISIGDEGWVHGYVDEIRKDCIIIRNDGGYFGTVAEEIGYFDGYEDLADTPQTEKDETQIDCRTCRQNKSGWYEKGSLSCERCCGANFEFYEPKDESQERNK